MAQYLRNCNAYTAGGFDLVFGCAREKPGLVNHGRGGSVLGRRLAVLFGHQGPDLVQVDRVAVARVLGEVKSPHSDLSKVSGMVLVKVDAVMMLTTGETATTTVTTLAVLANTTLTVGHVTAHLSRL